MDSLYDRLLREFQRLKKSSGFGEVFVSLPSISHLTLVWENDAIDMIYGERVYYNGENVVWMLHVPKEGKPKLAVSHVRRRMSDARGQYARHDWIHREEEDEKDILQDMPDERAKSMTATLIEQLAKVEV